MNGICGGTCETIGDLNRSLSSRYLASVKNEFPNDFNLSGQDKLIFTMDITSLYTVIPNSEGLQAHPQFLELDSL